MFVWDEVGGRGDDDGEGGWRREEERWGKAGEGWCGGGGGEGGPDDAACAEVEVGIRSGLVLVWLVVAVLSLALGAAGGCCCCDIVDLRR